MRLIDYHNAAMAYAADQISGLDSTQMSQPIKNCPGWTAADLVGHLAMVNTMCRNSTAGIGPDHLPDPEELVGGDPKGVYATTAAEFTAAYADPATFNQEMPTPVGMYPGRIVIGQGTAENLIHGWDLAHSFGRDRAIPRDLVAEALGRVLGLQSLYQQFFEMEFYSRSLDPGPDATPQARLLAYLGRIA